MRYLNRFIAAACLMGMPILSQATYNDTLPNNSFIGLTFHDVREDVQKQGDKDYYAINTKNLVQFFEWLQKSDWQPISIKQVSESIKTGKKLPKNAILICFDDGALSSYTQVYPLLKQYKIPAVFAVVTSWANGNTKAADEAYGEGNLMNWDQMREMSQSGYAEFVTHSHDMHKGILANPQKNEQPAAITHQYFEAENRYETDEEYSQRVYQDLVTSKTILEKELGKKVEAVIWPYGAVNVQAQNIAKEAGLKMSFSLGTDSLNFPKDGTFQRGLATGNPTVEDIHEQMTASLNYSSFEYFDQMRAVTVDLSEIASSTLEQGNEKLGKTLDQLNGLASNVMIMKVIKDENSDGVFDKAYFHTKHLPVAQDLMNRVSWQARTRVFNRVYAELPLYPNPKKPDLILDLARDLIQNNKNLDGTILKTDDQLNCALKTTDMLADECKANLNQTLKLLKATSQNIYPYTNISNMHKIVLQLKLKGQKNIGLHRTVTEITQTVDLLNIEVDSEKDSLAFKELIEQSQSLNDIEKAKIIVTFDLKNINTEKNWKQLQKDMLSLQAVGIQKMGVTNYSFENAQNVHQYLYTPMSLNGSPLLYRDPFLSKVQQGVGK